jgi:hypothetical protein
MEIPSLLVAARGALFQVPFCRRQKRFLHEVAETDDLLNWNRAVIEHSHVPVGFLHYEFTATL